MVTGVTLRPWARRDRRSIEHWPPAGVPEHWIARTSNDPARSLAIDVRNHLIGRISLRTINANDASIGIYLHPSWRGHGYGVIALQLLRECSEYQRLFLEVATDNEGAIRAYRRAGWETVSVVERNGYTYWMMEAQCIQHCILSAPYCSS